MAHRLRTFIAVDLGKPLRDRLVSLQENLARSGAEVKWVEVENLHVTLLFLGEVDERELLPVCRAVSVVVRPARPLSAQRRDGRLLPEPSSAARRLGRRRHGRAGAGRAARCAGAAAGWNWAVIAGRSGSYTPHITLGRVKSDALRRRAGGGRWRRRRTGTAASRSKCEEVLVMSSQLTSQGPEYTVLSRGRLRKPSGKHRTAAEEEE